MTDFHWEYRAAGTNPEGDAETTAWVLDRSAAVIEVGNMQASYPEYTDVRLEGRSVSYPIALVLVKDDVVSAHPGLDAFLASLQGPAA